jgi:hypothetical protein
MCLGLLSGFFPSACQVVFHIINIYHTQMFICFVCPAVFNFNLPSLLLVAHEFHQVLLSALRDHDLQVVYKAADIIMTLNKVLMRHGLVPNADAPQPLPDLVSNCVKPTNSNFKGVYDSFGCEVNSCLTPTNKTNHTRTTNMDSGEGEIATVRSRLTDDSDEVIESIVNETDINLLADFYRDYLNVGNNASSVTTDFSFDSEVNVSAKEFLSAISKLNLSEMVTQKTQWLDYCSNNLGSLLDDILSSHADTESNAMDCY